MHGQLHTARTFICVRCGAQRLTFSPVQKVCAECRPAYLINKTKEWHGDHKEHDRSLRSERRSVENQQRSERRRKLRQSWGMIGGRHVYELIRESEKRAEVFLTNKGFEELVWASSLYRNFPFDWIARKQGRLSLIDVTATIQHSVQRKWPLLQALGAEGFILFVGMANDSYALVPIIKPVSYIRLESNLRLVERR